MAVERGTILVVLAAQHLRLVDRTHRVVVFVFGERVRVIRMAGFTAALDEDVSLELVILAMTYASDRPEWKGWDQP